MKKRVLTYGLLMTMVFALVGCEDDASSDKLEAEAALEAESINTKNDTGDASDIKKYEVVSLPGYVSDAETTDSVLGRLDVVCRSEVDLYVPEIKPVKKAEEKVQPKAQPKVEEEEQPTDTYEAPATGNTVNYVTVTNISPVTYDTAHFSNTNITTPNTNSYFVNAATQKAYKIPASTGTFTGQAASDISQDMLSDVFGITGTYGSGHTYTYDNAGYLSIYDNYNFSLTVGSNIQVTNQIYNDDFAHMTDSNGNNLKTVIDASGVPNNKLKYTYTSEGVLTLTRIIDKEKKVDTRNTAISNLSDNQKNAITTMLDKFGTNYSYGDQYASVISYRVIEEIAGQTPDVANEYGRTFYSNEIEVARAIIDVIQAQYGAIDPADKTTSRPDSFKLVNLSGEEGLIIYYTSSEPFPYTTATTEYYGAVARKHYDAAYTVDTPRYIYNNLNTYGTSYYLTGNSLERNVTRSTINETFLRTVFPAADGAITTLLAEMDQNPNRIYTITIDSSGFLSVTHKEPR